MRSPTLAHLAATAALALLALTATARADVNLWQHEPGTVGNWFNPADWSLGVLPSLSDGHDAHITGGRTVAIAEAGAAAQRLMLGVGADQSGAVQLSAGSLHTALTGKRGCYVGYDGTGLFQHTGGLHSGRELVVGANPFSSGTYELGGSGDLAAGDVFVGYLGGSIGRFTHTAGMASLSGSLYVGAWSNDAAYTLSGSGQITAQAMVVGYFGGSDGRFEQTGGIVSLTSQVSLGWDSSAAFGDARGTYRLSGGSLTTPALLVGTSGYGTLELAGAAASLSVSDTLRFGTHGSLWAVADAAVRLTGATAVVENLSTDPNALAGLSNLSLIYAGGTTGVAGLELAGADLGAVQDGFADNFALKSLQVGDAAPARLRLADAVDNHLAAATPEALYVDELVLTAGSELDLAGLYVYTRTLTNQGGTIVDNGGLLTVLPPLYKADFNGDNIVNGRDFLIWQAGYPRSSGATRTMGDSDGDGDVDGRDFLNWQAEYRPVTPDGASQSVPEPLTAGLVVLGSLAILRRGRRSR